MSIRALFDPVPVIQSERLIIRKLTQDDADDLKAMVCNDNIYRYAPAFLFELKYEDIHEVIDKLYTECLEESLILGVFLNSGEFCGLAEFYGYSEALHKISIGYRSNEKVWGKGIATEAVKLMLGYLDANTDITTVTASTLSENKAAANVLRKTGFQLMESGIPEDWGYEEPLPADKWVIMSSKHWR